MFCTKCGAILEENQAFCSNCGTPLSGEAGLTEKPKAKNKKDKHILIILIAVIAVFVIIFSGKGVNATPEKVAAAAVESEYEIDIDKMVKCFPDFTIRELAAESGLPRDASRRAVANEIEKDYLYAVAYDVDDIYTEVIAEYDIDDYTLYREMYDYMTDREYNAITKVAKVYVEFTVDGEQESVRLTCIEMKNKWYLLRNQ